jgi:hypothetical protein
MVISLRWFPWLHVLADPTMPSERVGILWSSRWVRAAGGHQQPDDRTQKTRCRWKYLKFFLQIS